MRILRTGETFIGKDYTDMINEAIGTKYRHYERSTVDLAQFGVPNVIAWFVYMDGSKHGDPDGLEWRNILSSDGKIIREHNVSDGKQRLKIRQIEEGYNPYKLCFQLDHNGTGKKNWCKFIGAFRFSRFLEDNLTAFEFVKVMDEFKIGSIGDGYNSLLNSKDDFLVGADLYKVPIEKMEFTESTYRLLQSGGIKNAGDLLELGIGIDGHIADEIRQNILKVFH